MSNNVYIIGERIATGLSEVKKLYPQSQLTRDEREFLDHMFLMSKPGDRVDIMDFPIKYMVATIRYCGKKYADLLFFNIDDKNPTCSFLFSRRGPSSPVPDVEKYLKSISIMRRLTESEAKAVIKTNSN